MLMLTTQFLFKLFLFWSAILVLIYILYFTEKEYAEELIPSRKYWIELTLTVRHNNLN